MIVTYSKLGQMGQLGNQLFQIASTIGIAKDNKMFPFFFEWEYNKFLKHPLPLFKGALKPVTVNERNFHYNFVRLEQGSDYDLNGYFQSEKYFERHKDLIRRTFEFSDKVQEIVNRKFETCFGESAKKFPVIALHLRFGDYLTKKGYHTCLSETDYYQKAVSYFKNKFGEQVIYCIFSDDKELAYNFASKLDIAFYVVDQKETNGIPDNILDLALMSKCHHFITANSSFSWWSCWLSLNSNKEIVAPEKWFGKLCRCNPKDLYCPDWIKI